MKHHHRWSIATPVVAALVLILSALVPVAVPRALAAGRVTLSSALAVPGETVTVHGAGFTPTARALVTIDVPVHGGARRVQATATVSGSGTFTVALLIPLGTGEGVYTVQTRNTYGQAATARLTVLAGVSVRPGGPPPTATVRAGQRFLMHGLGFRHQPGPVRVVATFPLSSGRSLPVLKVVQLQPDGTFDAVLTVPSDSRPGRVTVSATGPAVDRATALIQVVSQPYLVLGAPTVAPGGIVTVNGYRFIPVSQIQVTLGTLHQQAHTIRSDQHGAFRTSLTVPPSTSAGAYTITAKDTLGRAQASARVTVVGLPPTPPPATARIFLQPTAITPGQTTTVFGSGFSPGVTVTVVATVPLYGGGSRTLSTNARTNLQGEFSVRLGVPANAAAGTITITMRGPRHQASAPLQLQPITPVIVVSPAAVSPGGTVTVRGSGYLAGSRIDLSLPISLTNGAQVTVATAARTTTSGQFAATLRVPTTAAGGTYTIQARSEQSGRVAQARLQVGYHPSIAVRPTAVAPSGTVAIAGAGFVPGATIRVSVTIGRTDNTTLTLTKDIVADGRGAFTASLALPSRSRPGRYTITASDLARGSRASVALTVAAHATIALAPSGVLPGQVVAITGAGFSAGVTVHLTATFPLYGGGTKTDNLAVPTDGNGAFATHLTVPSHAAPTTITVTATGSQAQASTQLQVRPLAPGITLSPASLRPGATVTVQGAGYLAGSRIDISLVVALTNGTRPTLSARATANSAGRFGVTVHIPTNVAVGTYTVVAKSEASGRAPTARLTVTLNPLLTVQPGTVGPGQTVTISGGGFSAGATVTLSATVPLYGGGSTVVTTTVRSDTNGAFTGRLTIPRKAASGTVVISARGPNAQRSVQFVIQGVPASLSLAPPAVLPGSTLQLRGSGYPANDRVDISLPVTLTNGAKQTLAVSVTTDAQGRFASVLHIPATVAGGTYTVVATSTASGRAPSARLTVTRLVPSVVAVPTPAVPGTPITVNGFGFAAGTTVAVSLNGQAVGNATANGAGQFSLQVTVPPTLASGTYALAATSTSGRKATTTLTVTRRVSTHFYFASLYTGNGYHVYLALLNPTAIQARVTITYQPTLGASRSKTISINPHTRFTEDVNADLGVHVSAAAAVSADVPIAAERMVFHGSDGAVAPGTTSPSTIWYFANGNTGKGYREYVAIQNPNNGPVQVAVRFLPTHHRAFTIYRTLGAQSRTTVKVNTFVHQDAVGVILTSNGPVVAARTIFIHHGMTSKIGVSSPSTVWYFAAGPRNAAARHWIGVINPNGQAAYVTLHAYGPSGSELGTARGWVKAYGRVGYLINKIAHRTDVAMALTSSRPIVAEQTTYVGKLHDAATDTFGVATPAKSWVFAAVNTSFSGGDADVLDLFNPNLSALPIVVQFMRANGSVSARTYVVGPLSHVRVDVGSVVPNAQLGLVAASNQPFVALNRSSFNNGRGSATSTGIHS